MKPLDHTKPGVLNSILVISLLHAANAHHGTHKRVGFHNAGMALTSGSS